MAHTTADGGSGSVHSIGRPGSPGSVLTAGPGQPGWAGPGPGLGLGLDSKSHLSHTSHTTNPNFPLGASTSTMSFGGDVDDDLEDDKADKNKA